MSLHREFKAWNRMPPGGSIRSETPDGVVFLDGAFPRCNLYDESKAPMIGSGDWEVNHDHYEPSRGSVTRIPNGR